MDAHRRRVRILVVIMVVLAVFEHEMEPIAYHDGRAGEDYFNELWNSANLNRFYDVSTEGAVAHPVNV
jgi:hypothetical protein